jgi:antitoxin component YwqK of YwqJK toxin-antitoxin module
MKNFTFNNLKYGTHFYKYSNSSNMIKFFSGFKIISYMFWRNKYDINYYFYDKKRITNMINITYKDNFDKYTEYIKYYENGNIWKKYICENKKLDGEYIEYYENGNIKKKYYYKNGKIEGEYIEYDRSGKISGKYYYESGKTSGKYFYKK